MVIKAFWLVKNRFSATIRPALPPGYIHPVAFKKRREIPYSFIRITQDGPIVSVVLNRPENGNRIDAGMAAELRQLAGELSMSGGVRVVLLTGSGRAFSVGRSALPGSGTINPGAAGELQAASSVAAIPVPVLAALNGDATDHGLELALACDLRVAAAAARLGFSPPATGSLPFDGGTQRLPRLVGPAWAKDMLLTGRQLAAEEALAIGLVNRVAAAGEDVMDVARSLASEILEGSPIGARYVKEAISSGADMTLGQALGLEADMNIILQSTADRAEGIASFLERRAPEFRGE